MLCPLCQKETPCCDCDVAWLESRVRLYANHLAWREQTRQEQAEQMKRVRVKKLLEFPGVGQLARTSR